VNDPIAIALKGGADIVFRFRTQPSTRIGALCCLWRENVAFALLEFCTDGGHRRATE
jgi:hypothetical protein